MKNLEELLTSLNHRKDCLAWVKENSIKKIEDVVSLCPKGEWLLDLAQNLEIDHRKYTLAKALCAKTVIHLVTHETALECVEVAEAYGKGVGTKESLDDFFRASSTHFIYHESNPEKSFAEIMCELSAIAALRLPINIYLSEILNVANFTKLSFINESEISQNEKDTANICREVIGSLIIEKVNSLLNK